uniref:BTB domain-containing protein n=1 Tax=Panagrellus redivivus TaxID=6233 RepID=A0A7E4VQ84_PANRE
MLKRVMTHFFEWPQSLKALPQTVSSTHYETPSVETAVNALRFADKYGMKGITKQLAKVPRFNLSVETFPTIVHYADDCSDSDLFDECCAFFKEHQRHIRATEKFGQLPPSSVAHLLGTTFDLETQFDILRHAHANGIDFILDPLEQLIIEALSLDTFCDTAKYAWECSRDDLKKACAKICIDNLLEIIKMKAFIDLSPEVLHGVIKLGHEIVMEDQ